MRSKWLSVGVAAVLVAALGLAACGGDDEEGESAGGAREGQLTPVTMASLLVASDAPIVLGKEKGFFEDEGIDLRVKRVGAGGAAIVPALLEGKFDVAAGGLAGAIQGVAEGLPLKLLGKDGVPVSNGDTPPAGASRGTTGIAVPADSDIRSLADLEGKQLAAITLSGLQFLCVSGAVEKAGVDPDDVRILEIPPPEMVPALESGRVDAATLLEPFLTIARQQGFRILGDPCVETMPGAVQAGFLTSETWVDENPEVAADLANALTRANDFSTEHPDQQREVIPTFTDMEPALAQEITLSPFNTSGENTAARNSLDVLAELMVKFDLLEEKPDLSDFLTGG